MSRIFVIMGKSATGKDTVYKKLVQTEELNLKKVISYTTRPIRKEESDGIEYYFVDENKLKEMKIQGKIIELRSYNTVHGVWNYFTADDGQIKFNGENYIMISTLEAYAKLRNYYGADTVIPIYIEVEDGVRLFRALERERKQEYPKYSELCRRYLADEEDFKESNLLSLGVKKRYNNLDFNVCIQNIIKDIGYCH